MKDNLIYQKSRIRWIRDGDVNSKFFHAYINKRRRHNKIHGVKINGIRIDEPK